MLSAHDTNIDALAIGLLLNEFRLIFFKGLNLTSWQCIYKHYYEISDITHNCITTKP